MLLPQLCFLGKGLPGQGALPLDLVHGLRVCLWYPLNTVYAPASCRPSSSDFTFCAFFPPQTPLPQEGPDYLHIPLLLL